MNRRTIKQRVLVFLKYAAFIVPMLALIIAPVCFHYHLDKISKLPKNIDPELLPLYELFLKEGKVHGKDFSPYGVTLKFATQDHPSFARATLDEKVSYGICDLFMGEIPTILINSNEWKTISPTKKEMIVFHELGHCLGFKGHSPGKDHQINKSLMTTYMFSEFDYKNYRDYYLEELFSYNRPYQYKDYLMTHFIEPGIDISISYGRK